MFNKGRFYNLAKGIRETLRCRQETAEYLAALYQWRRKGYRTNPTSYTGRPVSSTAFRMVSACRVLDFKAAIPMTLLLVGDDVGQLERKRQRNYTVDERRDWRGFPITRAT